MCALCVNSHCVCVSARVCARWSPGPPCKCRCNMLSFLLEGCVCFPFISSRGSEDHISNERTCESSIEMMGHVRGYSGKERCLEVGAACSCSIFFHWTGEKGRRGLRVVAPRGQAGSAQGRQPPRLLRRGVRGRVRRRAGLAGERQADHLGKDRPQVLLGSGRPLSPRQQHQKVSYCSVVVTAGFSCHLY